MKKFFQPVPLSPRVSFGFAILRIVAGLAFMFHGYGKIQSPFDWMGPESTVPGFLQALAAVSEFFGGLAWILGLLTPLASLGLLATMAEATRLHMFVFDSAFVATDDGLSYELSAIFLCIALLLILAGPGRYSLDRLVFKERGGGP